MPTTERCGMCAHYTPIEGIFGECKEKDTVFSADPKCGVFVLKQQKDVDSAALSFADFGSRRVIDPNTLGFMGMGLPVGFIPMQRQPQPQPEPEAEKTEWVNPAFRRVKSKHKSRKVINLAEAIAERKKS